MIALSCLVGQRAAAALSLSHQESLRIGRQIWQNECGGTVAGLTSWNAGEDFASLGIGHFIWYPAGESGPFEESFPKLLAYVKKQGAKLPGPLLPPNTDCPWNSRAQFLAAASTPEMIQLRKFLAGTIDLQADFLVRRLQEALPKMLSAAPASKRAAIERNFNRVAGSAQGCYALIDYVNFKGEGVLATERYHDRGWGLLQVIEGMSGGGEGAAATREFAESAEAVLRKRVRNAPAERHEARWLTGWLNRVATYRSG
ncbi:MAG: hypothetical protein H0X34_02210 [Chthoniobacterales bacterium]|nr:hypothetical protein [Chthoniobacterales bacterium]